jgi:glycosyltransferase involved in cell wall biosynthesis
MNGIFEFDQAKALVQAGCKVVYAAVDLRSIRRSRHWGIESIQKDGVQIETINIPCGNIPRLFLRLIGIWGFSRLYKWIVKKYGIPDIAHAHFTQTGYIAAKVLGQYDIPLVITEHSSNMNKDIISKYLFDTAEFAYKKADLVIAVGNSLAKRIEKRFSIKPICIPNIVDTSSFQLGKPIKRKEFTVVTIGGLIPKKKMNILIEAFNKAFPKDNNYKLYIFGEGPERGNLEKLILEFNLSKRVFLMGLCDRRQIAETMKSSDCFALASESETFGVAYIEALAAGLPVIATRCGGPEDFVTEENGIMIPVNDVDALVKAMKDMFNIIENYDRKRISNMIRERFAPETIASMLIKVYEEVIKNNKGKIEL